MTLESILEFRDFKLCEFSSKLDVRHKDKHDLNNIHLSFLRDVFERVVLRCDILFIKYC